MRPIHTSRKPVVDSIRCEMKTYRVIYLMRAKRAQVDKIFESIDYAANYARLLKRRGFTAWVEDDRKNFVPVKGIKRQPSWIE